MLCPFSRGLASGSGLGLSAGSTVWCLWRGRQRHIFIINILSARAGQSRPTARVLRGRVATEGKLWCPTGKSGHGVTPESRLWQELGLPTQGRSKSRGEAAWSEEGGTSGEMGPCPQVAARGREVEGGQRGGDCVCVVSPVGTARESLGGSGRGCCSGRRGLPVDTWAQPLSRGRWKLLQHWC